LSHIFSSTFASSLRHSDSNQFNPKMTKFGFVALALVFLLVLVLIPDKSTVDATNNYRKPPFNGSIFGKRNSGGGGSEGNGKITGSNAMGALCEIAMETCSSLYLEANRWTFPIKWNQQTTRRQETMNRNGFLLSTIFSPISLYCV